MQYPVDVKTARMNAVVTKIDAGGAAGKLELGTAGMTTIIATVPLNYPCGSVTNDILTLAGFSKSVSASATGTPAAARIRTSANADVVTALTVGLTAIAAPAWAGSTAYTVGQYRTNGANQYVCATAGTSAALGGPTGTGTNIADGTAVWNYACPANAEVQLDSISITSGQSVTINASPTITHAA